MNYDMEDINLVYAIVWKIYKDLPFGDFEDLFQEGCLAYFKAKKTFDPNKGKLSTYAWVSISGYLLNYHYPYKSNPDSIGGHEEMDAIIGKPNDFLPSLFEALTKKSVELVKDLLAVEVEMKTPMDAAIALIDEKQYSWPEVWEGFREVKKELNTIQ